MCNLYDVGPAPERLRFDWEPGLREVVGELSYVAPGRTGVVARAAGGRIEPARMRWGFQRPWGGALTNARDDKLTGTTWGAAWRNRRCILPVRQFYEWSGLAGRKTKHAIRTGDTDADVWFWIGGLWEDQPDGPVYSMVTTAACPDLAFLHGRMPLILAPHSLEEYLFAPQPPIALLRPYAGPLRIEPPPALAREEALELF